MISAIFFLSILTTELPLEKTFMEHKIIDDLFKAKWELNEPQINLILEKLRIIENRPDYEELLTRFYAEAEKLNPAPINSSQWDEALDAPLAAPNHKVIVENSHIRVLYIVFEPGEESPFHTHQWAGIIFDLIPSDFIVYEEGGKETFFSASEDPLFTHTEGQYNAAKNMGDTVYEGLHFEIKY